MRKIKANVKNNDRITINYEPGYIHFYYQTSAQNRKEYLYSMDFSGSVFAYLDIMELQFQKCTNSMTGIIQNLPR